MPTNSRARLLFPLAPILVQSKIRVSDSRCLERFLIIAVNQTKDRTTVLFKGEP